MREILGDWTGGGSQGSVVGTPDTGIFVACLGLWT
jgi:hypothetical protein